MGLKGTPKSLRDVWNGRNVETANGMVSVPAHDLALMIVDGYDESPQEYSAVADSITGVKAMRGPTFAPLQYANNSGHVAVVRSEAPQGFSPRLLSHPRSDRKSARLGSFFPTEQPTSRSSGNR
jgi:hypothetical protein